MLSFQKLQTEFTAHLRDPQHAAAPGGIEERRLKIYRELFYNNIEGFLANAFPVLRQLIEDARWHAMVRDFFARHQSHDPLFHGLAEEFLRYLDDERGEVEGDAPYLRELAHYEWVELALSIAEDELTPALADPNGDLLDGAPLVSPLAWTLAYDYPVHRIGPEYQPQSPGETPTYLVVYRTRQDEVKFTEINAVTARLLALIEAEPEATGCAHLTRIAAELGAEAEPIIRAGHEMLLGLRARDVVIGSRRT
ncbi:MAG: putative DNA-binding domain-containing protein [Pseudomonadota bacterium]